MVYPICGWNSLQCWSLISGEIWGTRNETSLDVEDLQDTLVYCATARSKRPKIPRQHAQARPRSNRIQRYLFWDIRSLWIPVRLWKLVLLLAIMLWISSNEVTLNAFKATPKTCERMQGVRKTSYAEKGCDISTKLGTGTHYHLMRRMHVIFGLRRTPDQLMTWEKIFFFRKCFWPGEHRIAETAQDFKE